MREKPTDWLYLPVGAKEIQLWDSLHDGQLLSVQSDRLDRTAVLNVDVAHLRKRLAAAENMTFVLRFEGVQSVRAAAFVLWPGEVPVISAGLPRTEQDRLVDEYQAKCREESVGWEPFEASLAGSDRIWI